MISSGHPNINSLPNQARIETSSQELQKVKQFKNLLQVAVVIISVVGAPVGSLVGALAFGFTAAPIIVGSFVGVSLTAGFLAVGLLIYNKKKETDEILKCKEKEIDAAINNINNLIGVMRGEFKEYKENLREIVCTK